MSYNIVYAPELGQVVNAASGASGAIAAAEQQRFYDQLGEQQRQFDYGQMLRAEQIGLADAQSRAALGLRAYESDQYNALRRDQLGMNYALAQQEMAQQEAYRQAQIEQAQYQAQQQAVAAFAREHGAAMRQRQDQNFKSFITQLDAINAAAQDGQIDNDQLQAAYARLEQESGFPVWLPDEMAKQEMFQAQAEQQQQQQQIISGAFAGILEEGQALPPAELFMVPDKDGSMYFSTDAVREYADSIRNEQRLRWEREQQEATKLEIKRLDVQSKAAELQSEAQGDAASQRRADLKIVQDSYQQYLRYAADMAESKQPGTMFKDPPPEPSPTSYNFPVVPTEDKALQQEIFDSLPIGTYFVMNGKLEYKKTATGYGTPP